MPEPCRNYRDWLTNEQDHPTFHYWHWNAGDPRSSEQRLGQRIYVAACLLWTSLHDHSLATSFLRSYPNWSAICSYYSMVHVWRLFWFVAYGGYPTGHAQMASSLISGGPGARADWQRRSRLPIAVEAFQEWLSMWLSRPELAQQLPLNGAVFSASKALRNDSNYESLVLAHQYSHHMPGFAGGVDVTNEFSQATEGMHAASHAATKFVVDSLQAAFREECKWFGDGSPYASGNLYALLVSFVQDKINGYQENATNDSAAIKNWCTASDSFSADLQTVSVEQIGPAVDLTRHIHYELFDRKRHLMEDFREKVRSLGSCVRNLGAIEKKA